MFRSTKRNKTETTETFIPAQLDAKGFPAPPDSFILTHLTRISHRFSRKRFGAHEDADVPRPKANTTTTTPIRREAF